MGWIYYSVRCNALLVMVLWSFSLVGTGPADHIWSVWANIKCIQISKVITSRLNTFQICLKYWTSFITGRCLFCDIKLLWCATADANLFLVFRSKSTASPELHWNLPLTAVTLGWGPICLTSEHLQVLIAVSSVAPVEQKVVTVIFVFQMGKLDCEQTIILICLAWNDLGEAGDSARRKQRFSISWVHYKTLTCLAKLFTGGQGEREAKMLQISAVLEEHVHVCTCVTSIYSFMVMIFF